MEDVSPDEPTIALRFNNASFSYGGRAPALTGVRGSLAAGEALALVGPNGSGKSTLLKGILGLVRASSGSVEVLGTTPVEARSQVGYLPQSSEIDPGFPITVRQVVAMGRFRAADRRPFGWLRGLSRADRAAAADALARVGLEQLGSRRFGELSGGQRQRVLLARALAADPRILLLDEPFNGLDEASRESLVSTLRQLRGQGVAIVVSTHDVSLARDVCDQVFIAAGRQIAFGPIADTLTMANLELAYSGARSA